MELYKIKKDVSELKKINKKNKEKTEELFNDLKKWRKDENAPIPSKKNSKYNQKFVDSLLFLIKNKKMTGSVKGLIRG